jgi:DNA-binding MarR family transcriptional regulator
LLEKTNGNFLISQIKHLQGRLGEKILEQAGIKEFNGAQGKILYILWQSDFVPIVELSKKTGLAKTTLTSMLDRMEESGLIVRIYDKTDRRQIRISLTDKANSLHGDYENVSMKMSEIFYKGFSDDEIISFENMLNTIVKNLTEPENEKSNQN